MEEKRTKFFEFAIIFDEKQICAVSVYLNKEQTEGELGWILNKKYWGKGYATEAAKAVKDFAINELKVSVLIAHCDCRNKASCSVMEKIGLTKINDKGVRQYPKTMERASDLTYSFTNTGKFS